jgi:hypothetical protein
MTLIRVDSQSEEKSEQVLVAMGIQSSGHAILPKKGLELPSSLTLSFEKWLRIGEVLATVRTSSAWCLGDWLAYGEMAYSGRYRDAIKQTSLDYQTLRNYAWVARRFPISRRRESLSFGHHAEVASLPEPEQDFWLRKAEGLGWSTSHLRREVRASLSERAVSEETKSANVIVGELEKGEAFEPTLEPKTTEHQRERLHLKVPVTQFELCRAAAEQAGLTVEAWAVRALLHAAREMRVQPG